MIYVGVCREVADELYSLSYFDQPLSLVIPTGRPEKDVAVESESDAWRTRRRDVKMIWPWSDADTQIAINASSHVRGMSHATSGSSSANDVQRRRRLAPARPTNEACPCCLRQAVNQPPSITRSSPR